MASGLNSLAAVVLSDIVRPWKNRKLPASSSHISGEEDLQEVVISKTLSKLKQKSAVADPEGGRGGATPLKLAKILQKQPHFYQFLHLHPPN